jgi:hypothetical protein
LGVGGRKPSNLNAASFVEGSDPKQN